jgi:2-polyprenyl-3-methyl-5-hydroxy-6-metoxy-1,4-benzoquinol methylase
MKYTKKDFEADCTDRRMRHIKSPQRYRAFYESSPKAMASAPMHRLSFVQPHGLTLDLGCHDGQALQIFEGEEVRIIGVDVAFSKLQACATREAKAKFSLVQAWAEQCPFQDNTFDTVVLTEVLEHVIDPVVVIAEASRVLKPKSGRIFISSPPVRRGNYAHVRGVSLSYMRELLSGAGLEAISWVPLSKYTAVIARKDA